MSASRAARQRYLEGWVGGEADLDVRRAKDGSWRYRAKCLHCWAVRPRGRFMGQRLSLTADTQAEFIAKWLQHASADEHAEVCR